MITFKGVEAVPQATGQVVTLLPVEDEVGRAGVLFGMSIRALETKI